MKNSIKESLIDLALDTRDFEWLKLIKDTDYNMTSLKKFETIVLDEMKIEQLAEIENKLNQWEWPDLLRKKPLNFDNLPIFSKDPTVISKRTIVSPIIELINMTIGEKETLKWHHINNLNRTIEEFEEWWEKENKSL